MSLLYAPALAEHGNRPRVSCDFLAHRRGNAGDRPMRARVYPTDLTDALTAFLHQYNYHRCHTALGAQPPISRINVKNVPGHYI